MTDISNLTARLEQGYGCDLKPEMAQYDENGRRGLLAQIVKQNADDRKADPSLPELKFDEFPKPSGGVRSILGNLGVDVGSTPNPNETKAMMLKRNDPITHRDVSIYTESVNYSRNIYKPLCVEPPKY